MEEGNIVLIIITAMGILQVILNVYFARRNNEAIAKKDEADAFESAGQYYANLVDRLENRLAASDRREEKMMARLADSDRREEKMMGRLAALEEKCEKYEELLVTYEIIINAAQEVQDVVGGHDPQE